MTNILLSTLFNSGSMSGVGVRRSVEIQCNTEIDHREVKNDRKGIKETTVREWNTKDMISPSQE